MSRAIKPLNHDHYIAFLYGFAALVIFTFYQFFETRYHRSEANSAFGSEAGNGELSENSMEISSINLTFIIAKQSESQHDKNIGETSRVENITAIS